MACHMASLGPLSERVNLDAMVNALPFPCVILSTGFIILGANEEYLRITRHAREEIMGRNLFAAFPQDPRQREKTSLATIHESLCRALATRRPDYLAVVNYNIPTRTPAGPAFDERYWSLIHTPVLDEKGEVAFFCQNSIDVTELVRMQERGSEKHLQDDVDFQFAASVFSRVQALEATNRLLDKERAHLLNMFRQAPGFVAVAQWSAAQGRDGQ